MRTIRAYKAIRHAVIMAGFFCIERGKPLNRVTVWLLMLQARGLADQGADTQLIQDSLDRRNVQHTVRYTATNLARFERLWR